jgi:hypothetical protein
MELTLSTVFDHSIAVPGMGWPSGALRTPAMGPAHRAECGRLARSRLGGPTAQLALRRDLRRDDDGHRMGSPPNVLGFDIRDGASRVTA